MVHEKSLSLSLSHVFSSIDPESIDANGKQLSNQSQTQPRHSLHPFVSSLELVIAFHKCHNVFLVFAKNKRRERENLVEREIARDCDGFRLLRRKIKAETAAER